MGSDIFGALFASVSGLEAQSTNLSIIANNISNANTIGYKGAQVEFQTLVSGVGSTTNYASGGVTGDNRQLIDQQGLLQSTSSPTDIAIQGSGLFVVNTNAAGTGQVLYTRAGSFTQDSSGNFLNAAGYFLQAWPLDSNGLLPGAPGNTTNTTSSANLSSLQTVNVENVAGKASATSKVSISANLNAAQSTFPGASDTVTMDKNNTTNFGISANTVILPDAPPAGSYTQATGSITFAAVPANNDSIWIGGTQWTFKSAGAAGTQTNIQGASLAATMAQLATDLNASSDPNIDQATYTATSTGIKITYKTGSLAGNSYTLATGTGAANETVSGATLSGATPGVDGIVQGDQMTISTGNNPSGYVFTYGGITYSRNITDGTDAASGAGVHGPGVLGTTGALTFSATSPTTMTIPLGVSPASLGITIGTVVKLSGTASNGLAVNNVTTMDGNYYVTDVSGNNVQVTIPSTITPPSAMSLTGATFTSTTGSDAIKVTGATLPAGLKNGDTVVFSGIPAISADMTSAVLNNASGWVISNVGVPGAGDFTFTTTTTETGGGANSVGISSTTMFDTDGDLTAATATLSSRLFSGNILDASSPTAAMINTPSSFTTAALSFTIQVGSDTPSTFTYQAAAPNAALGQFNTLDSLATAISDATGLTARVVNDQLYVAAVDGTKSINFANGSATGSDTSPPLAGIDWVGELGFPRNGILAQNGRFSTMQGLANLVNGDPGLTASVSNPLGTASVKINVNDPLDTITFADGATNPAHTNTGSLLGELGLASSLNSVLTGTVEQTATFTRAYNPTDSTKNMASGAITPQFSRSITVYDSLGAPHNLNIAFLNSGTNTWEVEVYSQPASAVTSSLPNGQVANGTLTFNGDGSLEAVTSGLSGANIITWTNGASPSTVTINWGTAGAIGTGKTDGMSQFSSPFSVNFVNQNGAPVGALTGISISSTGLITASFSNGQTQNLYQIPLASFTDPDQLESLSGNVFAQTASSGQVNLQQIGATSVGTITSSALEESNVELATQLTNMIVAQQAYQANTKVIATSNTLLQALNQIIQ